MLKILRSSKVKKQIYIVLAVAVIATFAVSGIYMGKEDRKSASSVGRLNGHNISVQDYLASYKAVDHQARIMYGGNFDQIRQFLRIKEQAWDRLLFLNYAKKQGIRASNEEVVQWIASQPFLQSKTGFDERAYNLFLTQYLREDARHFEEEVRDTLTISKLQDKIESSAQISDQELRELYAQKEGERSIQYVILSQQTGEKTDISDDELKSVFPIYENYLREPAKARIRYIAVPKEKAEEFKDALKENEAALDAVASKYKLAITETPYFTRNDAIPGLGLINEVIDKTFTLGPHQSSEWIAAADASYKIELLDKKRSAKLTFEEGKSKLKEILVHQKSVEDSVKKLTELSKGLKASEFEKFAADQKMQISSSDHFKKGAYLPGIGPSESIEKALAAVKEGEISKVLPVPGGAALVKVLKNTPIDEKKFAEKKEALKKEALDEKSRSKMESLLENLRRELIPNLAVLKEIMPDETPAGEKS